jgi:vitamin B12 transporter
MYRRHSNPAFATAIVLLAAAAPLAAQASAADGEPLGACVGAVSAGRESEARALATAAEARYRALIAERPADPGVRVLLARVLVQCRIPYAGMTARGGLIGRANQLLEEALEVDPRHWEARFTLAMNHLNTPEFLGRSGDAIRELETLLEQQGGRADHPGYAGTYLHLGDLYLRRGREADARAIWSAGAELFPRHAELRARLAGAAGDRMGTARGPGGEASPIALQGIVVSAAGGAELDDPHSRVALRRLDVLTTPGGAADLMHALRTGPGTSAASEGSDLYVRGGDPAETPVWIDGARIFHPGRFESLNGSAFGILDPAAMRTAFFSSGGFSVRYGNALSGVLDVRTEDMPAVRSGSMALNSVQAGAGFQLPLSGTAGAWASARLTDAAAMLAMHGRGDEFSVAPRAVEGIGASVWSPRAGTVLKATGLIDSDRSAREVEMHGHSGPFASRGANRMLALSGRVLGEGGRASLRGSLSASSRTGGFRFGVLDQERTDRSLAARVDAEARVGGRARVRAGAEAADLHARYGGQLPSTDGLAPGSPTEARRVSEGASHLGGYVEVEATPRGRLALVAGLRGDRLPGEDGWTTDPRLAVAFGAAENWTLRMGAGVFHQGRWRTRYTVPDALSPDGVARRATHLAAGVERGGEPALKVEGYVKEYDDYAPAGDGPAVVAGRAMGADAIVRWSRQERLNGWLTYSLLHGRVDLGQGLRVPSAVDVTHSLTAVGTLDLTGGWHLGSTARFGTGRPYTAPGGEPNADRLPSYRRLDGRLTRYSTFRNRMLVSYLELLNVLDHGNVAAYSFDRTGQRVTVPAFFSRTAVVGLSYSF